MKLWIGIDNGATGSIGAIGEDGTYHLVPVPVREELNYTKTKQFITRIDHHELRNHLSYLLHLFSANGKTVVGVERPFTQQFLTAAVRNALRSYEATVVSLEILGLPYHTVDSKAWQKLYLPAGLKGSAQLKKASLTRGRQWYPAIEDEKLKDFDGLLIARYMKEKYQ